MKKYTLFLIALAGVFFVSCSSLRTISYDQLCPAQVSFPYQIGTVGIVNNTPSRPVPKDNILTLGHLEGEGKSATENLAGMIADSKYFNQVIICDSALQSKGETEPLTQLQVQELTSMLGVDMLISFERLLMDVQKKEYQQPGWAETGTRITADFLTQFHTMENYKLPKKEQMNQDQYGKVVADSIEVRLYFNDFYGDDTNLMKLSVYELDTLNVVKEGTEYYTNLNLKQFVNPLRSAPIAQKVFTPRDMTVDDGTLDGSNYYHNVRIKLPAEYGSFILNKYYENPDMKAFLRSNPGLESRFKTVVHFDDYTGPELLEIFRSSRGLGQADLTPAGPGQHVGGRTGPALEVVLDVAGALFGVDIELGGKK